MSVSIRTRSVSGDNHPLQIGALTCNCPRLEAWFFSHNKFDSCVSWSQSQPVTVQSLRLALDFVAVATMLLLHSLLTKSSIYDIEIKKNNPQQ